MAEQPYYEEEPEWLCMNRFVIFGVFLLAFVGFTSAQALSGSGTSSDPYEITTCSEFEEIEQDFTAHYELLNNIECSGNNPTSITGGQFSGVFNGNEYSISDPTIEKGSTGSALFAETSGGVIKNVILQNVSNTDGFDNTDYGAAFVVGNVQGGLTEVNNVVVKDSYINTQNTNTAGIIGFNYGGSAVVSNSEVMNSDIIGGLTSGIATSRWQYSTIDVKNSRIEGSLVRSYTHGGSALLSSQGGSENVLENSYARDVVFNIKDTTSRPGLIISNSFGSVKNSYFKGTYDCDGSSNSCDIFEQSSRGDLTVSDVWMEISYEGSLNLQEGDADGGLTDVYYNSDFDYPTNPEAGWTGLTTSEMQGTSAETNMAFDFENTWGVIENDYPQLLAFKVPVIDNYVPGQTAQFNLSVEHTGYPDQKYDDGTMEEYYTKSLVYQGTTESGGQTIQESSWDKINFSAYDGTSQTQINSKEQFSVQRYDGGDYTANYALVKVNGTYNFSSSSWDLTETEVDRGNYSWTVTQADSPVDPLTALQNFFNSILESLIDTLFGEVSNSSIGTPSVENPPSP